MVWGARDIGQTFLNGEMLSLSCLGVAHVVEGVS